MTVSRPGHEQSATGGRMAGREARSTAKSVAYRGGGFGVELRAFLCKTHWQTFSHDLPDRI
ncbi:hypothetical protein LHK_03014 [Laribacter hongkongensis HLHK9]|uniref:Uncharacterized protein n=1 Tax=Laribacter hongkongensis (strain HLHK9) TaxID=557598 RepID=C1D5H4_LARHH|nr:hypothetical protein LHK_03014 [Laribacter hongkongensis HLHK9]